MERSIHAFYDSLGRNAPHVSPTEAATTIQICEAVPLDDMIPRDAKPAAGSDGRPEFDEPSEECDLSVLGGSGYIATAIARAALAKGLKVRVLARNPASISESLRRQGVELVVGDIRDDTALALVFRGAKAVVDTAFPKGSPRMAEDILALAERVAAAAADAGTDLLVYFGTIGSMNMRDSATITDTTPIDPNIRERNPYARGKGLAEQRLFALHAKDGLPVCVLRPGVVVGGDNAPPVHPAVGQVRNGRHIVGSVAPTQPMPWVLVDDVADAVLSAVENPQVVGKTYNLVSAAKLSAGEYVRAINEQTGRRLIYLQIYPKRIYAMGVFKGLIKRLLRRNPGSTSLADQENRTMRASWDTSAGRRDLDWHPVDDSQRILAAMIRS